ncbi:glycosyltransferase family 2 protein [Alkalicoccobacillus porphyridii]|uniref:Glycosyltransferase family 2 protein n=1 Tax=Alkalicoccobacillus porphyridii TaxID=2597270 RepID=A0A554A461_9BACI|nr:glycosyltransferase family 2 protein [Alkalicoccobacillus porphyridii]TSB48478.1 glycosyltransferase family 2 protein [Alkalicoccobacillus porphyridii]
METKSKSSTSQSVAIILLNWNSYKDTQACMKSLENLNYPSFHVYVVDNASTDDSFEQLSHDIFNAVYSYNWTLHASENNGGFACGNNIAIKDACQKGFSFIWLLNNDTLVEPDSLETLVSPMNHDTSVGITGSKIYFEGSDVLWFAGGIINKRTGANRHEGMMSVDRGQYDQEREVDYIVGCSLLIRTDIVKEVGPLEEGYFLYYEDSDWNLKVRERGWRVLYVPASIIHHKVSQSIKTDDLSALSTYYNIRNAYLMAKNFSSNKVYDLPALLWLYRNFYWYHLKIILRRQKNKRKRSQLIVRALSDSLKGRSGKYFEDKDKMRLNHGAKKTG